MIAEFVSIMPLTTVPDNVQYSVIDGQGRLVATSESSNVTANATASGSRITIEYDVPDLSAGDYTVVFNIDGRELNTTLNVASPDTRETNGYITLDQIMDLDVPAETGTWNLYQGNQVVEFGVITGGHINQFIPIPPSFDSALLVVKESSGAIADIEIFSLNATMLKAIREVRAMVDRLQRELRLNALEFDDIDYLRALARARDRFNAIPLTTNITMLNAAGPIRGSWLTLAAIEVLRTRSLEEGLTNYDYQGAAVTLSVDTRASLDEFLLSLETRILDEIRPLKSDLHRTGNTSGDGNFFGGRRSVGAVGITLGPASSGSLCGYDNRLPGRRW